jgi:hypothetical protein
MIGETPGWTFWAIACLVILLMFLPTLKLLAVDARQPILRRTLHKTHLATIKRS